METIVVKNVTTQPSGWTDIELEDGRVPSTKDEKIILAAKEASASGEPVQADINTRVNGSFTNHYLNQIGDVKESRSNGQAKTAAKGAPAKKSFGKSPEEQAQIHAQWAFGRATELARDLGNVEFPLRDEDKQSLVDAATFLFQESSKLAKG